MKFISFFAGIGGIDLGLERAGHECVGQCEIDPYCLKVLEKHWPDVPRFGDITKVVSDELPEADLWAGGFPCQDISCAGKQAGIHGKRSGLFFDFMRLVRQKRPRFLLLENVRNLINKGLAEVLEEMAQSGYDAEWDCIPAAAVGAPHRRDRCFIIAYTKSERAGQDNRGIWARATGISGGPQTTKERNISDTVRTKWLTGRVTIRTLPLSISVTGQTGQWETEPDVGRVVNGVPSRVDRLKCLGNAVVPQVAEYIGKLLAEIDDD